MATRTIWQSQIEKAWVERSIIWLNGVRRAGKTYLCQSLPDIDYFDCELPRNRQILEDPENFLKRQNPTKRLVLDEIHRLPNPSEILKIAADYYPKIKIIATGSSTLGASSKFKDTLTGRKRELWLTPMLYEEIAAFGNQDIQHRFLYGGLPAFFLSSQLPEKDFQEWLDAYWAKDIQELFRLEKRFAFQKFTELLFIQSGSIFEATRFAKVCEVSRSTITNYLAVLEATHAMHIIRPFNTHKANEIISSPKIFGFDTGFVCHNRGWRELHQENLGFLWEHLVLNEIQGRLQIRSINYWRDKQGHEIDFVLARKSDHSPIAIECKWNSNTFDAKNIKIFRHQYPRGQNFVVASNVDRSFNKNYGDMEICFTNLNELIKQLAPSQLK